VVSITRDASKIKIKIKIISGLYHKGPLVDVFMLWSECVNVRGLGVMVRVRVGVTRVSLLNVRR